MEEITLKGIVDLMQSRRDQRFKLFLGAKAGIFFENEGLYDLIKQYSTVTFDTLESAEKFQTCYRILENNFSERDRDSVLSQSLGANANYRLEDDYLGAMIHVGLFDAVISTNIDLLLEDALKREHVLDSPDYRVHIYDQTTVSDIVSTSRDFVLKIFGDLESKQYKTAGDEFVIAKDPGLRDFLEEILAGDVLILGYDAEWDKPLDECFLGKGGDLIYVNDAPPGLLMARALKKRKGKCLIGKQGTYKNFMRDLHAHLFERGPLAYEALQKVSEQIMYLRESIVQQFQHMQDESASLAWQLQERVGKQLQQTQEENVSLFWKTQENIDQKFQQLREERTLLSQQIQEDIAGQFQHLQQEHILPLYQTLLKMNDLLQNMQQERILQIHQIHQDIKLLQNKQQEHILQLGQVQSDIASLREIVQSVGDSLKLRENIN